MLKNNNYNIPKNLYYTKTHEWILINEDETITVGITDYAQDLMGDIIYIEFEQTNIPYDALKEAEILSIDSVKSAAGVYSPCDGKVIQINEATIHNPSIINKSPYEDGWLFTIKIASYINIIDLKESLIDAMNYEKYIIKQ